MSNDKSEDQPDIVKNFYWVFRYRNWVEHPIPTLLIVLAFLAVTYATITSLVPVRTIGPSEQLVTPKPDHVDEDPEVDPRFIVRP